MDRLEAMSIFLQAVDAGSLSAAGRRLGMPLASVSRKVSDLEAHLKTRLLNRSARRLTLTDAGRSYVAACKRILDEVGEAERTAAGEYGAPKGDLVVTAPIVFGRLHVLPVVSEFLTAYPDVDIRLVLADHVVHLLDDHIDIAIRIGSLANSSLVARRLGVICRVVCASPAYLARRGTPQAPGDLGSHDCVNFVDSTASTNWVFGSGKSEIVAPVRSRLIVNTAEAAIDAAIGGVGITRVFSYQAERAVRDGRLRLVLRAFETASWPVSLVYADGGLAPLKQRAFLDFASPRLKERVSQSAL
jgi:DNA-binding transcriptional LysR family regulator